MTFTVKYYLVEITPSGPVEGESFYSPGMAQACRYFWEDKGKKIKLRRRTTNQDGVVILDEDVDVENK